MDCERGTQQDSDNREAAVAVYLARRSDLRVRARRAQDGRSGRALRSGTGSPCARLAAVMAALRRASAASRIQLRAQCSDAAAAEHVSSPAGQLTKLG